MSPKRAIVGGSLAFLLDRLHALKLLNCDLIPADAKPVCGKLQVQHALEQLPGTRTGANLIQPVERAGFTPVYGGIPATFRTWRNSGGVINLVTLIAAGAGDPERARTRARTLFATLAIFGAAQPDVNQKPKARLLGPVLRLYKFGTSESCSCSMAAISSCTARRLWCGGTSAGL